MADEPKQIFRGVLRSLLTRHVHSIATRVAGGHVTTVPALTDALLRAALAAGSEASRLLGAEQVIELLRELCPPRERTQIERQAFDIARLIQGRRFRLQLDPWHWDHDQDLESQLIRLFTEQPQLALKAAAYTAASPDLRDEAGAETLCGELERALRTFTCPAH